MRTDISLRSATRTLVVDAKFYADPFPLSGGVPKVRSGHLYQLFAYMKHAEEPQAVRPVSGALIYASPGESTLNRYEIDGHQVTVASISLAKPWREVHGELLAVITAPPTSRAALGIEGDALPRESLPLG